MTPGSVFDIIETTPDHVRDEIRAAFRRDPKRWHNDKALRLWRQAMTRTLESRGWGFDRAFRSLVELVLISSSTSVQ